MVLTSRTSSLTRVGEADELSIPSSEITAFIQREWKRDVAISQPSFYDWQFRRSPQNNSVDRCLVVVDRQGEIAGFMGLNARTFLLDGRRLDGAELTTWMVTQKSQGHGYGLQMLNLLKQRYEVLLGMGVSEPALPLYAMTSFRYVRHLSRYVKVFHADHLRAVAPLSPLAEKLIRDCSKGSGVEHSARSLDDFNDAGEYISQLHQEFNCFARDARVLEWRYAQHPVYHYERYVVQAETGSMIVVLRRDQAQSLRVVHVIDAFGSLSALPAVVEFLERYCREHHIDVADCFSMSDRLGHVFRHYGWFSTIDDPWIQVPHLFHPVELRTPPTTSLIMWARAGVDRLLQQSRLHVMKGDCDLDRPTMEYIRDNESRTKGMYH